jgi:rod shape-determining protein MreC
MNKKVLPYLFVLIALFVGALYYTNTIQSPLLSSLNTIKVTYHNVIQSIGDSIDRHFFQAQEIDDLKAKLRSYEKSHLLVKQYASELEDLYKENNSSFKLDPKTELIRTISYEKFGNLNRIWLDIPDYNASKVYGLIHKNIVAGIVVAKDHKALGLLNTDMKSTYAVYVGKSKAPGIAHGNNDQNLIVNFIPAWFKIEAGDEVITSGLDHIFFKGLKVGKVISVSKSQGYQNALIKPYYQANDPAYFHIIRSVQ